jgi:proteasome lid subunit RPN8/RPN11
MIRSHSSVEEVRHVAEGIFTITVRVPLPSRLRREGTPSGVRALEDVQIEFRPDFPLTAPRVTLRPDFNPNLPHINPFRKGDRIPPCLLDGDLDAFHSQMGILSVINQLVAWLEKAGVGALIDPAQGWEPSRRDALTMLYDVDLDAVRRAPPPVGKYQYWDVLFKRDIQVSLVAQFDAPFTEGLRTRYEALTQHANRSIGVLAMCDDTISSTYHPETVSTLGELTERAKLLGCDESLQEGLRRLRRGETPKRLKGRPIVVVLVCRRPYPLIGTTSSLEMLGYVLAPGWIDGDPACEAIPAGHRQAMSIRLLREVSGYTGPSESARWGLLGAGSLGSKIGMHMARCGLGPSEIHDNGVMEPHNFARHALCPSTPFAGKANGLSLETRLMGQVEVRSEVGNLLSMLAGVDGRAFDEGLAFVVNTTGSIAVREALAAALPSVRVPRVVEASLLARGELSLMTTEGEERNPSTMDLSCLSYRIMAERETVAAKVFSDADRALRIGQGCSSRTMVMSDATIASHAGPMTTHLSKRLSKMAREGEIVIWERGSGGLSLSADVVSVGQFLVINAENDSTTVRVSPAVVDQVRATIRGSRVEQGGILLGRFSDAANTFHVVDCLPAPPDSASGPNYFVLGTEGVRASVEAYEKRLQGALYCVGTWHSHPGSAKSSGVDRRTSEKMRDFDPLRPMAMLIVSETSDWSALRVDSWTAPES